MQTIYDARLLLVDDTPELLDLLCEHLRAAGYHSIATAADCRTAREAFAAQRPELMILDINLPDGDGFALFRQLRAQADVPALFLSARDADADRLFGLGLGADDYLTKPFALEELEARVRTLLRREFRQRESLVQVGALTLNTVTREVSGRGEPLPLTPREFAILEHLMLHRGCWISQEELMEHIWEADANPFSNAVRMHISSLRKKLRKRLGHDPIQTKVGRGYRLAGEETA